MGSRETCLSASDSGRQYKLYFSLFSIYCFLRIAIYIIAFCIFGCDGMFDAYGILYWTIDYSNGFLSRGLAGELFFDSISAISDNPAFNFVLCKVIYVLVLYATGVLILRKCIARDGNIAKYVAVLFIHTGYLTSFAYGFRTDMFWYISLAISICLLWNHDESRSISLKMLIITALTVIAMMFHQAFIFIFAPLICVFLIDKKQKIWFIVYGITASLAFVLITIFGKGDYDIICQQAMSNLIDSGLFEQFDGAFEENIAAFRYEYLDSRATQLMDPDLISQYVYAHLPCLCVHLILGFNSLLVSIFAIKDYIKTYVDNKYVKILIPIVFILPFVALLCFTIDCDRWFLQTMLSLNIFSLYVIVKKGVRPKLIDTLCSIAIIVNFVSLPLMFLS